MNKTATIDDLLAENKVLKEHLSANEDMLLRTTSYMSRMQDKLEKSKTEIEEKNAEIFQSLRYAERIQKALRPSFQTFNKAFNDSFIHIKQRDIIGGDFAFLAETENYWFFAGADCTGHGIPGAMISMLAQAFLNEIILQSKEIEVDTILSKLNHMFIHSLNRGEVTIKDGLDIALCRLDKERTMLSFSSAKRPLYLVPNGHLEEYKGTKISIGESSNPTFEVHHINVKKCDKLYLFSDGIVDQFGGPEDKKYGSNRLRNLIESVKDLKMRKQSEIIGNTLESWARNSDQTDDQLIIGICI